ncbi:type 2 isopentenyl-diphosphate Delta-isomerase [Marinococcus halophilus]|uniref:Isopentenyl-diphosphate delta-isomerase n=1 Tax=Marinococcus halophilus TaxID=1371 RepID=A0A510Y3K5_MARHA|nr:type 2 isopentenyl-diphosphate Delta-isomerase [Marinococcus halophilus]OZT80858.1 type 2 isopentenyl-diphosphate Delta-isomerase [Marinococcus halophilus]GEK57912.1 isopentenyl-diphosphate delta-isomerase [Marinococcus halophilus]
MSRARRKQDHIEYALSTGFSAESSLDDIQFVHQSLPDSASLYTDASVEIGGLSLSSPILINAMTGGGGDETAAVNASLAEAAAATGVAMAVGSQTSAIKNEQESYTYKIVREKNPDGVIFANTGSEVSVEQAAQAVEMIQADALQIHLNVIQELVMPEGDRDFQGALERIKRIAEGLSVPVIVKEVGFGISFETAAKLRSSGVVIIDAGGSGGTNFSMIENKRRNQPFAFFDQWGIPTAAAIAETVHAWHPGSVIGSGGVRHGLDIAKIIALGGSASGMAGAVLREAKNHGADGAAAFLRQTQEELKIVMTAVGAQNIEELKRAPVVLRGETAYWLKERGIDTTVYSRRSI